MRIVAGMLLTAALGLSGLTVLTGLPAQAAAPVVPGEVAHVVHVKGGRVDLPFTGTAGRLATVLIGEETLSKGASIVLVRPDGTDRATRKFSDGMWFRQYPRLDATGTWKLSIRPAARDRGDVQVVIRYARTSAPTLAAGEDSTVRLTEPGTVQAYTFTGRAGRRPILSMPVADWRSANGATLYPGIHATLYRPNGTVWADFQQVCGTCSRPFQESRDLGGDGSGLLDRTGTWTLVFDTGSDAIGSSQFRLDLITDRAAKLTPGTATTVKVATRGQKVVYSFAAKKGQRPVVDLISQNWVRADGIASSAGLILLRPNGTHFYDWSENGGTAEPLVTWFESKVLDATGTWKLVVDPVGDATGSQQMNFNTVTEPAKRAVSLGARVVVRSRTAGANQRLTFASQLGKRIVLDVDQADWRSRARGNTAGSGSALAELYDSAGKLRASMRLPAGGAGAADLAGPATGSGTWTVRVNPEGDSTGSTAFTLSTVTDVTATLTPGTATAITLTKPYQQARLTFPTPGDWMRVRITGAALPVGTRLSVVDPTIPGQSADRVDLTRAGDVDELLLPADGQTSQTLVIDPAGPMTGTLNVLVTSWG